FSSERRPRALAWQLGFSARRATAANAAADAAAHAAGGRALQINVEYAHVYRFTYSVYHHHDFEFDGLPTGFPLGPDVDRLNGRLEWRRGPAWAYGIE